MGEIVLHGISAIEAWDIGLCRNAQPVDRLDLAQLSFRPSGPEGFPEGLQGLSRPIHVAVANDAKRRNSRLWRAHVVGRQLPRNSFFQLAEGLYVEAPYLCFVQFARNLPVALACLLGMELCGRYSTLQLHARQGRTDPGKGYLERPPLSTASQLRRYVQAIGLGRRSASFAACKDLENGARSPREAVMHVLVHRKPGEGGYGLSGYALNAQIKLTPELRGLLGARNLEADMYWEKAGLALEYDGKDYHSDDTQRAYDNIRRSVLRNLGISVVTVDKWQMRDMALLDGIMQMVAESTGGPPVRHDEKARVARRELRALLLQPAPDLYGCGSYDKAS